MSTIRDALVMLADLGGPVILILLIFSIVGSAVALLKAWQFLSLRLGAVKFAESALQFWQKNDMERAIGSVKDKRHPVAKVLYTAFTCSQAESAMSSGQAREETLRVAYAQLELLRNYLRVLEVIASLSPLLGLLGTVMGMIEVFRELEMAGSRIDPSLLSGGIWEALLTTSVGLAVAIPAILVVSYFDRVVERVRHRMEDVSTRVFTTHDDVLWVRELGSSSRSSSVYQA